MHPVVPAQQQLPPSKVFKLKWLVCYYTLVSTVLISAIMPYHAKTPLLCGVFSWFLARIRTVLLRSKRGSAERTAEKLARSLFKQAEEALADILPGVP